METLARLTTTLVMFSALVVMAPIKTQAQSARPVLPKTPPDIVLKVERQSGNCPKTIGIWTAFRYYEGGGEHTVIADTWAIADHAQLVSSGKKVVEYKAPLKTSYASCVSQAKAEDYGYRFRFGNGNVSFRVELPPDTAANPSEFTARSILGGRPYVRWAIAD
jgi:hypothetical protein